MYLSGNYGGINTLTKNLGLKSHSQIKEWIRKYKESGISGLDNKTGKFTGINKGRPRKKKLSKDEEILKLRAENEYLKGMLNISNKSIKKKNNSP